MDRLIHLFLFLVIHLFCEGVMGLWVCVHGDKVVKKRREMVVLAMNSIMM